MPASKIIFNTNSSLYGPNNAVGNDNVPSYVVVQYPGTLKPADYNLNFSPNTSETNAIGGLLNASGKTFKDVYYMDITLTIKDVPDAPNPIGEVIEVKLTGCDANEGNE